MNINESSPEKVSPSLPVRGSLDDLPEGGAMDIKEVDIGKLIGKLVHGWKVLLGAALIGALVGTWVVWAYPNQYQAKVFLSATLGEEFSPVTGSALGTPKPSLEVLQEYANQITSPAVLEKAAKQLSEKSPGLGALSGGQLRTMVTVSPVKEEGRLMVQVEMSDPELARTAAEEIVPIGIQAVGEFRANQQKALRKYVKAGVASAQQAYQEAQDEMNQWQRDQKYIEKNARLREANRRVELLQQMLITTQMEMPKIETYLQTWELLLPSLPATTTQTFRWEGIDPLVQFLAKKWGVPQEQFSGVKFVWEAPSVVRQEVEKNLLQQQTALQALQNAQQVAQKMLLQYLDELNQTQAEVDALNASLAIIQCRVNSARNRYTAAQEALAKWEEDFIRIFPFLSQPSASSIVVQSKGLSAMKRWIGIELLALCGGAMVVFLLDASRRQAKAIGPADLSTFSALTSEEQEMLMAKKRSA